jgi:hypothetical protein
VPRVEYVLSLFGFKPSAKAPWISVKSIRLEDFPYRFIYEVGTSRYDSPSACEPVPLAFN